jgi:hypothetical protein
MRWAHFKCDIRDEDGESDSAREFISEYVLFALAGSEGECICAMQTNDHLEFDGDSDVFGRECECALWPRAHKVFSTGK